MSFKIFAECLDDEGKDGSACDFESTKMVLLIWRLARVVGMLCFIRCDMMIAMILMIITAMIPTCVCALLCDGMGMMV